MSNSLPRKAEKYRKDHSRYRAWQRFVSGLACAVVFCTTYALILPAITMEQKTYCGLEAHQHGPACFEKTLICEIPEAHLHTDSCYIPEAALVCPLEESEETEHQHDESCYETTSALACSLEENHVHIEDCYEQALLCSISEHSHDDACSVNPETGDTAYTWQSEDGAMQLMVVFEGLPEVCEATETQADPVAEQPPLVLQPELNWDCDPISLQQEEATDSWQLLSLRLHLMRGEEEIDLSGCTAKVSLTATPELVHGPEARNAARATTQPDALSVVDGSGNELTSGELGMENATLDFTMQADVSVSVFVTSNPSFTLQHYLQYQKVALARESTLTGNAQLEFLDTSLDGVFAPVEHVGARTGLTLNNRDENNVNPNNGALPDTFKINLVQQADGNYHFEANTAVEPLFTDELTTYRRSPQILYMNRLYNGLNSLNEFYTLYEIWVYQPPNDGLPKDTDSLTEGDFIKYRLPLLSGDDSKHDPEKIRFTNNPSNTHISQLDADGKPIASEVTAAYPYVYTVLIQEGTVVRLVFNGTEDVNFTTPNVQFFDYDISDGLLYQTEEDAHGRVNGKPVSEQDNNLWYTYTNQQGINAGGNYPVNVAGTKFAFGNSNTGTGLGFLTWNGNELNKANTNSYKKATFGLATGLTWGEKGYPKPVFAAGIASQEHLFGSGDAAGKTSYLDGYKLNFHRIGGTYILNSVIKQDKENGEDDTVLAGLRDFKQTGVSWSTKEPIFSNEFWPLDGCDSHGTDGHDMKFGQQSLEGNRRFIGVTGGMLPSADIKTVDHNAYLGMSYSVDFTVTPGYCARMNYWFYGDDDMWVFLEKIDDQGNRIENWQPKLIADVGGIHPSVGEYVNLWEYVDENPMFLQNDDGTIQMDESGYPVENQRLDRYRMTVFYTERGASGSSCYMRFNLPALTSITPPPERDEALVFEKRLLGMDANEVPYDSPDNKEFSFLLTLTNENGTSYEDVYDYSVYSRGATPDHTAPDAQPLRTGTIGTASTESGKYIFTLKGGEYIVISNLPDNTYYTIEENLSEDYVTYFQKGTHKHIDGEQVDTLGGLERYSAATGGEMAQRYNGSEYNYIRFTNAPPFKTEPDPGPEKPVQVDQVITYEIDWRKAVERDLVNMDLVQVMVRDPLDPAVDFVGAKFEPSDGSQSWWDNTHSYLEELPQGVSASIAYDAKKHEVVWNLTYPKGTEISGVVALRVRVSPRVDFTQTENPKVVNGAYAKVGENPEIETNWIWNPLERAKTTHLKVLKTDTSKRPLAGALFVLYKKEAKAIGEAPVNCYYSGHSESAFAATWAFLQDGEDERVYAWRSGTDGYLTGPGAAGTQTQFSYLADGTYYLKEVKSPDGYKLLGEELTLLVDDGTITVREKPGFLSASDTDNLYILAVPNSTGYELPQTGGRGTIGYKTGGLLIMTAAFGMYIGSRNRRRRERRAEGGCTELGKNHGCQTVFQT